MGWRPRAAGRRPQALRGVAAFTHHAWLPRSATSGALCIRASSWAISAWFRQSIPAASARSRGSITKTGNAHARRLLTEAAWNYRFKARIGKQAQIRQQELSEPIRMMAWKAQLRLTQRFATLNARGLHSQHMSPWWSLAICRLISAIR